MVINYLKKRYKKCYKRQIDKENNLVSRIINKQQLKDDKNQIILEKLAA